MPDKPPVSCLVAARALALLGPGAHAGDPVHLDVGDVAGRRDVHVREADTWAEIAVR
jgi:hypothetical protein